MKMAMFFLAGMVASLLIVWALAHSGSPVNAEEGNGGDDPLLQLPQLPDIKGIYRACLTEPFKQVESEIHDPEIANYYHKLMQETGLTDNSDQ
jgi:hypothetical protein